MIILELATKSFNKKLFEQNDPKARQIAIEYFAKQGYDVRDNPNKYGVDLIAWKIHEHDPANEYICEDCSIQFCIEVEIKRVWKGDEFPWLTVQFPERKAKYIYQSDKPVKFFMLNAQCNRAFIVDGAEILKSKLKMVPNMYMRDDEYFFQVPIDKGEFVEI